MATIKFKLDKEKIFLHYRQADKEFRFYTPFSCKKNNWDGDSVRKIKGLETKLKGRYRVKGNTAEAIRINAYLDELELGLKEIVSEETILGLKENREADFYAIKNRFLEKFAKKNEKQRAETKEITLPDLFNQYIEHKSHYLNKVTLMIFKRVLNHIIDFANKYNYSLSINNISIDFYAKYQKYLIEDHNYSNSTINVEIKKIKEVSSFFKEDYPEIFIPGPKLKRMPEPEPQRFTMTYQEAELFFKTQFVSQKVQINGQLIPVSKNSLETVRDCYVFSFNTGIPYEPLCKLTEQNLSLIEILEEKIIYKLGSMSFDDSESLMNFILQNKHQLAADTTNISFENKILKKTIPVVQYHRDKNKKILVTPLNDKCLEIIEKYKGKQKYLLPMMTNQKINFYLHIALKQSKLFDDEVTQVNYRGNKTILKKMPRYEAITFHSARHGFASYLLNSGLPMAFIQKLLGHSDLKTTQIYAKADASDVLKRAFELLK